MALPRGDVFLPASPSPPVFFQRKGTTGEHPGARLSGRKRAECISISFPRLLRAEMIVVAVSVVVVIVAIVARLSFSRADADDDERGISRITDNNIVQRDIATFYCDYHCRYRYFALIPTRFSRRGFCASLVFFQRLPPRDSWHDLSFLRAARRPTREIMFSPFSAPAFSYSTFV